MSLLILLSTKNYISKVIKVINWFMKNLKSSKVWLLF